MAKVAAEADGEGLARRATAGGALPDRPGDPQVGAAIGHLRHRSG